MAKGAPQNGRKPSEEVLQKATAPESWKDREEVLPALMPRCHRGDYQRPQEPLPLQPVPRATDTDARRHQSPHGHSHISWLSTLGLKTITAAVTGTTKDPRAEEVREQ